MKVQIVSDLHLEFDELRDHHGFNLDPHDRDLLILAGDIHTGSSAEVFIEQ